MAGRQLSDRDQGSATLGPARTRFLERLTATGAAAVAFLCYYATLLPGLDLGDSASFQTGVGSLTLTPRQAYPLYYGLGNLFVWLHPGEPARALNFASAVYGAVAVGLATRLASRLVESVLAGAAAGLFLAFSYTFWSQAITAEVYTLHLVIVGASLLALVSWAGRPCVSRLALFYAIYALGFGNHLSMILLLPALVAFLLLHRHPGAADPLRRPMIAMAAGIAAVAALQYAWNLRGLWAVIEPPSSFGEAIGTFWFDVTKADWRETLVMNLSETGLQSRPSMYWFDLRQQFGVPGVALAAIGLAYVSIRWPRRGIVLLLLYAANLGFAWTYNVGDAYIFFLPSHYVVALWTGAGVAALVWLTSRISSRRVATAAGVLCLLYPAWRGYDTFPAVDRSWDWRALRLLENMTSAPDTGRERPCAERVFGLDANWQVQNAFEYFVRERTRDLSWFTTDELSWLRSQPQGLAAFVGGETAWGNREVLVTDKAIRALRTLGAPVAFGEADADPQTLLERVEQLPRGLDYALGVLRPDREFPLDRQELDRLVQLLTSSQGTVPAIDGFAIMLGRTGEAPVFSRAGNRPFRASAHIGDRRYDVRMESWLPADTIRRSGFGHVIVNRSHALTLERGVSLLVLDESGSPLLTEYRSSLFEVPGRFRLGFDGVIPPPCYR